MTHFVHPDFRDVHPGVERVERAATALKDMASRFDGVRGGASLLLVTHSESAAARAAAGGPWPPTGAYA